MATRALHLDGTLIQFGGLAIMPFALIVLSGDSNGPPIIGHLGAGLAFLLVGAGLHTTQTVGLALATDLAPSESHPRVVALLMHDVTSGHGWWGADLRRASCAF